MHRSPKYFENPETFHPERWAEGRIWRKTCPEACTFPLAMIRLSVSVKGLH
ncbi:cytochrome P450 [Scytonema hofmannii]|uniref:cytochrome P450 n=1 Tax=Scytonema hofmannii TaxID=34078 RepID=UPI00300FAEE7